MVKKGDLLGAIDIGSNAIRFTLFELNNNLEPVAIERKRFPVRLGSGTFSMGSLHEADMAAAIDALHAIADGTRNRPLIAMPAIATSAVRDAKNQDDFLNRVKAQTGIAVTILSGAEEARLAALGAGQLDSVTEQLIIDVGGGSTEVALFDPEGKMKWDASLPLGAVRLSEDWGRQGLYTSDQMADHRAMIRETMEQFLPRLDLSAASAIAMGGTVRALLDMKQILEKDPKSDCLHREDLLKLCAILAETDVATMPGKLGVDSARAPIMLAGAEIVNGLMSWLKLNKLRITDAGVREGLAREAIAKLNSVSG